MVGGETAVLTLAPYAPIEATLAAMRARLGDVATHGVHTGLIAAGSPRWTPATRLTDGTRIAELIDTAKQRWSAQPHAAAALAWKSYTYWLSLPVMAGYSSARRVPLLRPEDVLLDFHDHQPFLTVALRTASAASLDRRSAPTTSVAVLPSDPLAAADSPTIQVVRDERALHRIIRESLLESHLYPVLEQIRSRVNLGRRTLLGSIASGIAYGIVRSQAHVAPESTIATVSNLLADLNLADLVDLSITDAGADSDARAVRVQRRTCCLAFTLPEPKICSGCVLRTA